MKRFPGGMIAGLAAALVLVTGTSSRADFGVDTDASTGRQRVRVDNGYFATNRSLDIVLYNATGSQLSAGLAVVPDVGATGCPTSRFCVKPAPAAEDLRVIGVTTTTAEDGLALNVAVAGIFSVSITGSVSAGDLLKISSTTAGKAEAATSAETGVFAVALDHGKDNFVYAYFIKQEIF